MIQALNVELIILSSVLCHQKGNIYKQKMLLKKESRHNMLSNSVVFIFKWCFFPSIRKYKAP